MANRAFFFTVAMLSLGISRGKDVVTSLRFLPCLFLGGLSLMVIPMLIGCTGPRDSEAAERGFPTRDYVAVVMNTSHQVASAGYLQEKTTEGKQLADALASVVHGLEAIKGANCFPREQVTIMGGGIFSKCPPDFQKAFDEYIVAWRNAVAVAEKYPSGTYPMWCRITALPNDSNGSEMNVAVQTACRRIDDSYRVLERIAAENGVDVNRLATRRPNLFSQ
jgi:hypothetical protein